MKPVHPRPEAFLSPLALTSGKERFEHEAGWMAYRRHRGLDIALGDPIAADGRGHEVLAAFVHSRRQEGRQAAAVPVSHRLTARVRGMGLAVLRIGMLARLDLPSFRLEGPQCRNLRHTSARARRAGLTGEIWEPPQSEERLDALERVSRAWVSRPGVRERPFGMGWFHRGHIRDLRVAVAVDRSGRPTAFVTLHEGHPGETGLDRLRHRPDAPPGAMETALLAAVRRLQAEGGRVLDLGLVPLAENGEPGPSGIRLLASALRVERWYRFRGLQAFKEKFRPRWEPRYLVVTSAAWVPFALAAACDLVPSLRIPERARRMARVPVRWLPRAASWLGALRG